jgi:ADP-ribosylglycohydrolase
VFSSRVYSITRGDSDTLAAITGGIAEAAYGIPDWIASRAKEFLDKRILGAVESFYDSLDVR